MRRLFMCFVGSMARDGFGRGCLGGRTDRIKAGGDTPQDYPTTKGDYEFARLVKERTNGRIVVEV